VEGAYRFCKTFDLSKIQTILLIDDVTTTGATLNELAGMIKQYYPHIHIWGVVVARHG